MSPKEFEELLSRWKTAALRASVAEDAYRVAHAKAFAESDAKSDSGRKAAADIATSKERQARDLADIEARAVGYYVDFVLRGMGAKAAA